jgi:hypothetical protein
MPPAKCVTIATPGVYQIRVQGALDASWSDRMRGVNIQVLDQPDGASETVLTGHFVDQAALSGVLNTLYDLSFPLLEVVRLEAQP